MDIIIYTLSDGKEIRYVGKTKNIEKRYKEHIRESKQIKTYKERWVNSVLRNGGTIFIESLEIVDESLANESEIFWINQLKYWGFNLVNTTKGGDGGSPMLGKNHNEETKKKMSETHKGKTVIILEETKKKISEKLKGRILYKMTEEIKKKISEKLKGRKTPWMEKPLSEETKKKISELKKGKITWMKGRHHTKESKKILSEKNKNYKHTQDAKNKISEKQKIKWIIKTPNNDLLEFFGYDSFKEYVIKNSLDVSVETLKSYGKNKGWVIENKIKLNN